jgi:hypothetical protein
MPKPALLTRTSTDRPSDRSAANDRLLGLVDRQVRGDHEGFHRMGFG